MLKLDRDSESTLPHPRERTPSSVAPPETVVEDSRRVTPQELAEAIAALEKRKNTIYPGSIALDSALREMEQEANTPRIRKAIETRRERRQRGVSGQSPGLRAGYLGLGLFALFLGVVAFAYIGTLADPMRAEPVWKSIGRSLGLRPDLKPAPAPGSLSWRYIRLLERTPTMVQLGDLKDGQPVTLDREQARNLQEATTGKSLMDASGYHPVILPLPPDILLETAPPAQLSPEKGVYVRYGKTWYRRGWTTETLVKGEEPVVESPVRSRKDGPQAGTVRHNFRFFSDRPTENIVIRRSSPIPTPPGLTPGQISKLGNRIRTETISLGPAKRRILIPVAAIETTVDRQLHATEPNRSSAPGTPTIDWVDNGREFLLIGEGLLDSNAWKER
ncbi:MAG: hypothetical protein SFU56_16405 [Capsulimonadales bacterium]|nr:hypothetical protein [Capsulimonadales bacterium]